MSADNWAICPKCKKDRKEPESAYGKVSEDEYKKLISKKIEPMEETLREDYEIRIDGDGEFLVHYGAHCEVCRFMYTFKHRDQLL